MGLETDKAIDKLSTQLHGVDINVLRCVSQVPVWALLQLVVAACDDNINAFEKRRAEGGGFDLPTYDAHIAHNRRIKGVAEEIIKTWEVEIATFREKSSAEITAAWERQHR